MRHKRHSVVTACVGLSFLFAPLGVLAGTPTQATVVISEIAWAGSSVSASDEWLELTNLSLMPIDLSEWVLVGAATSGGDLLIPDGSLIAPNDTFLITNYDPSNEKSALLVEPNFITSSLSLSNSGLHLILMDVDGLEHDRAGNGHAPFAGGTAGSGGNTDGRFASMVRLTPEAGDLEASWTTASSSSGFDEGIMDYGTPGTPDIIPSPGLEEETEEALEPPQVVPETEPDTSPETTTEGNGVLNEETNPTSEQDLDPPRAFELDVDQTESIEPETEPQQEQPAEPSVREESTQIVYPIGTLQINEFVSDPLSGEGEWIEILNPFLNVIDLSGWTLREGSGKTTPLPDQLLGWEQYALVMNPGGKLNNDGDTIELLDPSGVVIDALTYGAGDILAPKKPNALAKDTGGVWRLTPFPTPKALNIFPILSSEENTMPGHSASTEVGEDSSQTTIRETAPPIVIPHSAQIPESPTVVPANLGPRTLRLSELYPNTEGDDAEQEFIELENTGEEEVNLWGWFIEDASGKRFLQESTRLLPPNTRIALYRSTTNITLNNTSETIKLFAPDGTLVDEISYEHAKEGNVFAWNGTAWTWSSSPTPNEPNTFSGGEPEVRENDSGSVSTTSSAKRTLPAPRSVTILEAQTLPDGTVVSLQGIVTTLPGTLGSQVFYLENEHAGIQIYKYDAQFPDLSIGDTVTLSGTLSTVHGERRVKISSNDLFQTTASGNIPEPKQLHLSQIQTTDVGSLIRIEGIVVMREGDKITFEQEGIELVVRLASGAHIPTELFETGARQQITGVLTRYDESLRLMPRTTQDIENVRAQEPILAGTLSAKEQKEHLNGKTALILTLCVLFAFFLLAAKHYLPHMRSAYAKNNPLRFGTQKVH